MARVRITERAAEVVERVRQQRRGQLTFTVDGGCCEGTAPHLFEDAVVAPTAHAIGEVANVPVYLQPAMVGIDADADLVIDVIDRVPKLRARAGHLKEEMKNAIIDSLSFAHEQGMDRPEISDWTWPD